MVAHAVHNCDQEQHGCQNGGGFAHLEQAHVERQQLPQTATILAAMLLLVAIVDSMSYHLRRTLTR